MILAFPSWKSSFNSFPQLSFSSLPRISLFRPSFPFFLLFFPKVAAKAFIPSFFALKSGLIRHFFHTWVNFHWMKPTNSTVEVSTQLMRCLLTCKASCEKLLPSILQYKVCSSISRPPVTTLGNNFARIMLQKFLTKYSFNKHFNS